MNKCIPATSPSAYPSPKIVWRISDIKNDLDITHFISILKKKVRTPDEIDFHGSRFSSIGLKKIMDSLPEDIKGISFRNNPIESLGLKNLFSSLGRFKKLKSLKVDNIRMNVDNVADLGTFNPIFLTYPLYQQDSH